MPQQEMEARFHRFARELPSAESVDEVVPTGTVQGPRADYLWRNRTVITELKTLIEDPQGKLDREVNELSKRPDFPVFVGPAPVDKVLRHIPDGSEVMRKLRQKVLRSIEGSFRSAKHQIANTKSIFEIEDALGLLVVLNPAIETLDPGDAVRELSHLLERRQQGVHGIDAVWLLSEAHRMSGAHPCIFITGSRIERFEWAEDYLDELNRAWAAFNNSPLLETRGEGAPDLSVDPKGPRPGELAPKHEHWRTHYRANRYMEQLDDAEVLRLGQEVFAELMPYFLKGGPRKSFVELEPLTIRWTHFLEEAGLRGLNMRGFGKDVKFPPGLGMPPQD